VAQAVSRRSITAEAWIGPCGICGRLSGAGTGFLISAVFPVSIIPPWRHTHMRMNSRHVGGRSSECHRTSKSTVFCCRTDAVLPYSSEKVATKSYGLLLLRSIFCVIYNNFL
jgi:hypothetical protein